jgi:hypothetical protein
MCYQLAGKYLLQNGEVARWLGEIAAHKAAKKSALKRNARMGLLTTNFTLSTVCLERDFSGLVLRRRTPGGEGSM